MKWVYLIKAEKYDLIHYKIGITKNPTKRLKQLQTGNSLKLELLSVYETNFGNKFEKILHRTYNLLNENGEWFNLSDIDVKNFIKTCNTIENNLKILKENSSVWKSK